MKLFQRKFLSVPPVSIEEFLTKKIDKNSSLYLVEKLRRELKVHTVVKRELRVHNCEFERARK